MMKEMMASVRIQSTESQILTMYKLKQIVRQSTKKPNKHTHPYGFALHAPYSDGW